MRTLREQHRVANSPRRSRALEPQAQGKAKSQSGTEGGGGMVEIIRRFKRVLARFQAARSEAEALVWHHGSRGVAIAVARAEADDGAEHDVWCYRRLVVPPRQPTARPAEQRGHSHAVRNRGGLVASARADDPADAVFVTEGGGQSICGRRARGPRPSPSRSSARAAFSARRRARLERCAVANSSPRPPRRSSRPRAAAARR